jgi:phenylalanyl-tRNA synthetase alpha chain
MSAAHTADLDTYQASAKESLQLVTDSAEMEVWYREHLSKNGLLNAFKKSIGKIDKPLRKEYGESINAVARALEERFRQKSQEIKDRELAARIAAERIDVTIPSRLRSQGRIHPLNMVMREVYAVFSKMGFYIEESPHVELDEYNFGKLNMPPHHPARDMQDTFYVNDEVVLRTHTSPGQIRAMEKYHPAPMRVILPGLCYRNETVTVRSEMQFHQVEGLLVGKNVNMSTLKGVLMQFARMIFGEDQDVRFRGSYFPFTEPSVEVDILCTFCKGDGCKVCKETGWLELLGAGLVHPEVLRNGGYDPTEVNGFAWGMGIERMVMLLYGINDIRMFYRNDLRFLSQFH